MTDFKLVNLQQNYGLVAADEIDRFVRWHERKTEGGLLDQFKALAYELKSR